jgi:hypothetical protein
MIRRLWFSPRGGPVCWTAFFILCTVSAPAQSTVVETGTGTNTCRLILNFPAGEKVVFSHRWNGASLNAKTLLESVLSSTGGELVVSEDDYLTPFALVPMNHPETTGLVVHYQGSYEIPYINAIRWNGPGGPVGADYQPPDNWWHLWVQGPAHVDQSFAWPEPLPPVELASGSAWFLGEYSGLADLVLGDGATLGLVYGTSAPPLPPPPSVLSCTPTGATTFTLSFGSVPGFRYQLETRQDLAVGPWNPLGQPVVAHALTSSLTVPMDSPSGRAYFRIALVP